MKEGSILTNNQGCKAIVIKKIDTGKAMVRFLDKTGFERMFKICHLKKGAFRNPYHPVIFGVGYVGAGKYKTKENGAKTKSYNAWKGMLYRCYNDKFLRANPTYSDASVHPDWHNYQVFAEWFNENYIEGFHLDKDLLSGDKKIYGPNTCCFLSPKDNVVISQAKTYKFISPDGDIVSIYNLEQFCRDRKLHAQNMGKVHKGERLSCQGWTSLNDT